jgi:hypothetical protein
VTDLLSNPNNLGHRPDIVHAHDMSATKHRGCHGCGCTPVALVRWAVTERAAHEGLS